MQYLAKGVALFLRRSGCDSSEGDVHLSSTYLLNGEGERGNTQCASISSDGEPPR